MTNDIYKQKYLKYKNKYLDLVNQIGGAESKNQKLEGIKQLLKKKEFEYVLQSYTMAPIAKLLNLEQDYFTDEERINMIEMIILGNIKKIESIDFEKEKYDKYDKAGTLKQLSEYKQFAEEVKKLPSE